MDIKGYTYGFMAHRNQYRSEQGIAAQDALLSTGSNWVCLAVTVYQDTAVSTAINPNFVTNPSDRDIVSVIKKCHSNGVNVCLKPMVNCKDGTWRARISFPDMEGEGDPYWKKWFKSYTDFLLYYAELAEETKCEMLCIGCEMCGTEHKEKYWRELIAAIRSVYSGKLVYNTNHGYEANVKWFDAVDYFGTSAYFPVAKFRTEEVPYADLVNEMKASWEKVAEEMEGYSKQWGKKVLFMEIGCRSARGCASMPWDFSHTDLPIDEDEQAAFYESCLSVFENKDWFGGMFWWDWSTYIYSSKEAAEKDNGFNIYMKKAETVLKEHYSK